MKSNEPERRALHAAPKLPIERLRAIFARAREKREQGELFTEPMLASEVEALAHEIIDWRTNDRLVELERQLDIAAKLLAKHAGDPRTVSKSSPENDHVDAGKIVYAPGASRK